MIKTIFQLAVATYAASFLFSARVRVATRRAFSAAFDKIERVDQDAAEKYQLAVYNELCANFGVDPNEEGALARAISNHPEQGAQHEAPV